MQYGVLALCLFVLSSCGAPAPAATGPNVRCSVSGSLYYCVAY